MASNVEPQTPQLPPRPSLGEHTPESENCDGPLNTAFDISSLPHAVKARKGEYTRLETIHVKVGTWNVAAISGIEDDVGKWFVQRKGACEELSGLRISQCEPTPGEAIHSDSGSAIPPLELPPEQVGLYVLGLQEIVDVSSPTEALRPYVDPAPANRWKGAVEKTLPPGYKLIAETQLVGLLQLVYAAPSIVDSVSSVSCTNVGTGLLGYMGNKGAVATRLLLGETTCIIFINCHLAAGSDKASLERRNWDASQILGRIKFDPIDLDKKLRDEPSESIGDEDFAFWFGDLNYRLEDIPGDDVRQVLARHTENEYDNRHESWTSIEDPTSSPRVIVDENQKQHPPLCKNEIPTKLLPAALEEDFDPHADPASLQTTISSLLPHDQLRMQQSKQKAFHEGWREGQITFLPTYKYDVGSVARFDSSEKHRGPSWCDRILYRSHRDKLRYERLAKEAAEARKRDEEMKARGLEKAAADDSVLFDYDPEVDGADSSDEYDPNKDQDSDDDPSDLLDTVDESVRLDYYMSHQGILSSDHKPLVAGFTLQFESVDPDLKAKVHHEVARELDKAENESRPGLTVVVDSHGHEALHDPSEKDPNAVNFGGLPFDVPVTRVLTIANTSGVPATFSLERPDREHEQNLPSWLAYKVDSPNHDSEDKKQKSFLDRYTLLPGELANIEVTARVQNMDLVRVLNNGQIKLEEILILRVESGRDHFIFVYGEWLPTSFGRSLEQLTHIPEGGARSLKSENKLGQQSDSRLPISAPRELFKLTEAVSELSERAVAEWSMVKGDSDDTPPWERGPAGYAWPFESYVWTLKDEDTRSHLLAFVREALDTNKPLNSVFAPEVSSLHRLEILSETLLVFLRSLKDGIVSATVWQNLDKQILAREKAKAPTLSWEDSQAWVLESLAYSPVHSVSFTFVTFMLARITNEVAPVSPMAPRASSNISPQSTLNPPNNAMSARRRAVETALAKVFSNALISTDLPNPIKDKERRALEERKRSIIEPFLKTIGVDNNGPSGGAL